jgi:hypothetical protein
MALQSDKNHLFATTAPLFFAGCRKLAPEQVEPSSVDVEGAGHAAGHFAD